MAERKLRLIFFSAVGAIFLSGCSGFSRLPEINFVGKNRGDVVRILASCPEKTHDGKINLMIPVSRHNPLHCNGNIYFKTAEDALADEQIQNASAIGGYRTARRLPFRGDGIIMKLFSTKIILQFLRKQLLYLMARKVSVFFLPFSGMCKNQGSFCTFLTINNVLFGELPGMGNATPNGEIVIRPLQ